MTNTITVKGNLGKDPVALRFTQTGDPVASFSIADTPRRFNKQTNEWEDAGDTIWFDVSVWGEEAEQLAQRAEGYRGQITVTGRLGLRSYEANDGTTRTVPTVRADSVALHVNKTGQQGGGNWGNQGQATGGYGQRAQAARTQQATSGSDHLAQPGYQPGPGGPRQDADPWQAQPTRGTPPTYDEPPF